MVTHYVSLRIDEKDDKEDFKVWMEEFCEQLRIDLDKMIVKTKLSINTTMLLILATLLEYLIGLID